MAFVVLLRTGYIQPVNYVNAAGLSQFYCDGGLVCNFPLHCFDGIVAMTSLALIIAFFFYFFFCNTSVYINFILLYNILVYMQQVL